MHRDASNSGTWKPCSVLARINSTLVVEWAESNERGEVIRSVPDAISMPVWKSDLKIPQHRLFLMLASESATSFAARIAQAVKARSRAESYLVQTHPSCPALSYPPSPFSSLPYGTSTHRRRWNPPARAANLPKCRQAGSITRDTHGHPSRRPRASILARSNPEPIRARNHWQA